MFPNRESNCFPKVLRSLGLRVSNEWEFCTEERDTNARSSQTGFVVCSLTKCLRLSEPDLSWDIGQGPIYRLDNDASGAVTDENNRTLLYLVAGTNKLHVYPARNIQVPYRGEKPVALHYSIKSVRVLVDPIPGQIGLGSRNLLCDSPRARIVGIFQLQTPLLGFQVVVEDNVGRRKFAFQTVQPAESFVGGCSPCSPRIGCDSWDSDDASLWSV